MQELLVPTNDATALALLPEAVLVIDPYADRICYANPLAGKLLGCGPVLPAAGALFLPSLPLLTLFTQEVLAEGGARTEDLVARTPAGDITLEVQAQRAEWGGREVLVCTLRDRERFMRWRIKNKAARQGPDGLHWRRIHEVFAQIERENQLILSAAGEGIYGIDARGKTTFLNPAAERLLGYQAQELIGLNAHSAIHHSHCDGSDYAVAECPIYAAFKDGAVRTEERDVFWRKGGAAFPVSYTSTPIFDNGQLVGAVVVFSDITKRLEAEEQLRGALGQVEELKRKLELENAYLQAEISEGYNDYQLVGKSAAVKRILQQIELVAPTGATVLITGESGTGKELIARALHTASARRERPLVRVNCAAVPGELFESEFFGHVRGAFSGALQDRVGRFELADGGTLFLDEVGELPLALQGKLLRVLQDQEFERVGESRTRKVDVRIICATNRDLAGEVRAGRFREDLYFRLNVFPVHSPPLRERRQDIPALALHFLTMAGRRLGQPPLKLSLAALEQLQNYPWPGNIRELENYIERQVILSRGDKLSLAPLAAPAGEGADAQPSRHLLTEQECRELSKQALINALSHSRGRIYGADGAARALGVKPTTLASRLKKWGIDRRDFGGR